ncbi:MAG: polysaccharide deacetylase family protein [Burkholderiales bacterium]
MKLALRIEVSTARALGRGVPRLLDLLKAADAGGTFLFALGPDRTGRIAGRLIGQPIEGRMRPIRAIRRYGLGALLSGTLFRAPDLSSKAFIPLLRGIRDDGFEVGVLAYDHVQWRTQAASEDAQWTHAQMQAANARFESVFGEPPRVHGAAGWQVNRESLRLTQRLGYDYASDTRGDQPYIPIYRAEIVACPQLPTTLPTLAELNAEVPLNVAVERLLDITAVPRATGHVYAARADLEGIAFADAFEDLLARWRGQGYEIVSLLDYVEALPAGELPRHELAVQDMPHKGGPVAAQGRPFLA